MKNATVYPEWVQAQRVKGTTVKKVGNTYYLYKRTSKRVPGRKYPQPVDTYIGIITPDGIVEKKKTLLATTDVIVKEFGFSKAIQELCPMEWKEIMGVDWEDKLNVLITYWSSESYLTKEKTIKTADELRFSISSQSGNLSRRIYHNCGVGVEQLKKLNNIYVVYIEKQKIISCISDEQQKLLDKVKVKLEYS